MGAGKPIVAFDLPETRVSAGEAALYVPSDDVRGFAAALKRLIDSPQLRETMGRVGRQRVLNHLNWSHSALKLKEAYDSVFPTVPTGASRYPGSDNDIEYLSRPEYPELVIRWRQGSSEPHRARWRL